jgi:type III secretory pathway component EscS
MLMPRKFLILLDNLSLSPKRLFLIDSLGALLTAFLLGAILTRLEDDFGMPRKVLNPLSIVALVYALYSFNCYLFVRANWRLFLKIITIANAVYCCATIGLVISFYQALTFLGLAYFLGEISIIGGLVYIEVLTIFKDDNMLFYKSHP